MADGTVAQTTTYNITNITLTDAEKEELKGAPGKDSQVPGPAGKDSTVPGPAGKDSTVPGPQGLTAYEVAVKNGYPGTETEWLASLKGAKGDTGTGGSGSLSGIVQLDQFGGNDDAKFAAAIAFVKTQAKYPAIQLPARDINLTQTITLFTGLRIIAPFGSSGQKNLELANGSRYSTHRINLAANMTLFSGSGSVYDVTLENLVVQGNWTQQFLAFPTGTLYASTITGITAYGMKSVIGSLAQKALFTQVVLDGQWQVIDAVGCLFHIGGSDCQNFWSSGQLNIGGDVAGVTDYLIWLDGMGKTRISNVYITAGGGYGLRLNGASEGGINVVGAVIEGFHAGQPATQLVRVDGGSINLHGLDLGWANNAIVVYGGRVRVRDTNYYQDTAHQQVPLVQVNGGVVQQSGTAAPWAGLSA